MVPVNKVRAHPFLCGQDRKEGYLEWMDGRWGGPSTSVAIP